MAEITIRMRLRDDEVARGWGNDTSELAASIRATLHELNGDDGDVYVPTAVSVEIVVPS